uniref:Ig-like domain-containing protein n=1 Tax=Hucho hucho TaxID=62062 RepID=A0A4W5QGZ7_9TELE
MLDDVQVAYYDTNDKQTVYTGQHINDKTEDEKAQDGDYVFIKMYKSMKNRLFELKHHFNLTEGVQVHIYNMTHFKYDAGKLLPGLDEKRQECTKTNIENREKNVVMRKVPPRLRLMKKEVSGGFQVSCLAFGFYPRHINLTLLRDGQPVAEQDLTGGEVLPSGDGTYQLRKSLEVSTEELKKRHDYTCTASHLSLDNKLDVSWESGAERVHLSTLSALLVMVLIVIILGIFICVKRRRCTASHLGRLLTITNIWALVQICIYILHMLVWHPAH